MSSTTRSSTEGRPLTPRQQEIMRYICKGFTQQQTCEFVAISRSGMNKQLTRIRERLGASNVAEAGYRLGRQGFEA